MPVPLGVPTEEANRAGSSSRNRDTIGEREADEGLTRLHGKATAGSQHVETGIHIYMQASGCHQGDTSGPWV